MHPRATHPDARSVHFRYNRRISSEAIIMRSFFRNHWPIPVIVAFGLLLRLPFRSTILFNWDSVNYALGMRGMDLLRHRPHPPGNLLYIYLSRFLDLFFHDENLSMVAISLASGLLSAVILYLFARHLFSKSDAFFSALLLLTSPMAWLYDEVALTYSMEMLFSVTVAYVCYRALEDRPALVYPAAVLLALAGGFRPTSLLILGPLFAYLLLRMPRRKAILSLLIFLGISAIWAALLLRESGGLAVLLTATRNLSTVLETTTTDAILHPLLLAAHLCLIPIGLYWLGWIAFPARPVPAWERTFFNFWIAPGVLVILLYHMGQPGYLLFLLPALFLVTPPLLRGMLEKLPASDTTEAVRQKDIRQKMILNAVLIPLVGIILFFVTTWPVLSSVDDCWTEAQEQYGSADSSRYIVLTRNSRFRDFLGFRHAEYYLPNLKVFLFAFADPADDIFNPSGIRFLGWRFWAFQGQDNYERGPSEDEKQTRLSLPDGLEGILLTDPEMSRFVDLGGDAAPDELQEESHACFTQLNLPPNVRELRVEDGRLVIY
jgi:hypothetical protein